MFRLTSLVLFVLVLLNLYSPPSFAQQTLQQLQDADEARRRAATRKRIDDDAKRVEERRKEREAEHVRRAGLAAPAAEPTPTPVQNQRRRSQRR